MRLAAFPAREAALGDLSYDRASNLASWKLQSGTSATAVTAKHDAWNRLTEVSFGGTLRCRQAHNALHWRSFQLSDRTGTGSGAGAGPDGTMDQARLMSHGADWRLLEERIDDNLSLSAWNAGTWNPATDVDRAQQYVWGVRYVDDVVLHRVDGNLDGDYADAVDGTWHHLTDAQFSSVCLVDDAGVVAERVAYNAYGTASHLWRGDINADGAVNSADLGFLLGAYGSSIGGTLYRSEIDLNRDGIINSVDLGALLGGYAAALAPGTLSSALVDNPIGWDGYVFDRESGLYTVRFRTYETGLGRWMERDPAACSTSMDPRLHFAQPTFSRLSCAFGMNLFEAANDEPISWEDPAGLRPLSSRFGAFIPGRLGAWMPEPLPFSPWFFATDDRGFGGGTYRGYAAGWVESSRIGRIDLRSSGGTVQSGVSHRRKPNGAGGWTYEAMKAEAFGGAKFKNIGPCSTIQQFDFNASYPFFPSGGALGRTVAGIDFSWTVEYAVVSKGLVSVTITGGHDSFPDYEGFVDGNLIYKFATKSAGPSFSAGSLGWEGTSQFLPRESFLKLTRRLGVTVPGKIHEAIWH